MAEIFADLPEALASTVEIAERSAFRPMTRKPILPRFSVGPDAVDEAAELRRQAEAGLDRRIQARHELYCDVAAHGGCHAREKLAAAAIEYRHRIADAQPQYAREMLGLIARQHHCFIAGIESRGKEPVHGGIIERLGCWVMGAG